MILNEFPSAQEFYKTYWNKKPFIVRNGVDKAVIEGFIDGDHLAGLSLEEDIKSRLVITEPEGGGWTCHHGPLDEDIFSTLEEKSWSLLVQNVEQYHPPTANLLKNFHFTPRWLMDDIMVSYSSVGGSVGPHTDSYHVFLIQGMGKRKWKLGHSPIPIESAEHLDHQDLIILKNGFEGDVFEVTMGDVIYIPPHFGHEGTTIEEAMSFSIGFLGPKSSEMLTAFGQYLEQYPEQDKRYTGAGLDPKSAGLTIAPEAQNTVRDDLGKALNADIFARWMAQYFATPTYADIEDIEPRANPLSSAALLKRLQDGEALHRPEHMKIVITTSQDGTKNLALYDRVIPVPPPCEPLIERLNQNRTISIHALEKLSDKDQDKAMTLIETLYNLDILSFAESF